MASTVHIVDAAFRRTQIKVSPGKYMREVLEEVCAAKKLKPEEYMLKTQSNKAVDLSQPFRLSGLSAGAKLQLTQASRSPSVVSVALQLPERDGGGRLSDKFPSTTSIWLVLRKFEEGVAGAPAKRLNFTQRGVASSSTGAGRLMYEQPSVNVMGRTLESFTDCQKTLAQLGFNKGTVMLRLNYKDSGKPLEEAMQEITEYFKAVDSVPAGIGASASQDSRGAHAATTAMQSTPDALADNAAVPAEGTAGPEPNDTDVEMTPAPPSQPEGDDILASSSETQPQPQSQPSDSSPAPPPGPPPADGISIFLPPTSTTPAASLLRSDLDDTNHTPTIEDAKRHQAALARASRNTRLLSDKELAEQDSARAANLAAVKKVDVRVRYSDQSMAEFAVGPGESGADLYAKIRTTLNASDQPFELRYMGTKMHEVVPDSPTKKLVKDLGFRGRVLVTFAWGGQASAEARAAPPLREEYAGRARELKVELLEQRGGEGAEGAAGREVGGEKKAKGKGGDMEAKMKKFLGFGKK